MPCFAQSSAEINKTRERERERNEQSGNVKRKLARHREVAQKGYSFEDASTQRTLVSTKYSCSSGINSTLDKQNVWCIDFVI